MSKFSDFKRFLPSAAALVLLAGAGAAEAMISGAIYTSLESGTSVNANLYEAKEDVYLNGGPQNANAAGLPFNSPAGEVYYYQVTNPSGSVLLSTDAAECRQVLVAPSAVSGKGVISGPAGSCPHAAGSYNAANGSTPVQLVPYGDTPNNGGEYKVWLIRKTPTTSVAEDGIHLNFVNSDTKTDNFKVREDDDNEENPPPPAPRIEGYKFYDSNADGLRECEDVNGNGTIDIGEIDSNFNGTADCAETGIPFFQIELFGDSASNTTTVINPRGLYSFEFLNAGSYGVCEVIPTGGQTWLNTTSTLIEGIVVPPNSTGNNFGNVCLAGGKGRTLGFWSNKNGQAAITGAPGGASAVMTSLSNLNLRNGAGADFNPTSYAAFRSWLLGATANNMAYMLSAQMSAIWLNINVGGPVGKVPDTAVLYAGIPPAGCTVGGLNGYGFVGVTALINAANASLANPNGYSVAGSAMRSCQEFMKNALDRGNNNLNFVGSPDQCEVTYGENDGTCSPP